MSHFEVDLKSMRSTMKALEEELGTALVSQLNAEDQQEVWLVLMYLMSLKFNNSSNFKLQSL